jgi:hypothetical protein
MADKLVDSLYLMADGRWLMANKLIVVFDKINGSTS